MAKHKKKREKRGDEAPEAEPSERVCAVADEADAAAEPIESVVAAEKIPEGKVAQAQVPVAPKGRLRRWLPDLVKVAVAFVVIGFAAAIWYQPPLVKADFPYVSYFVKGEWAADAVLYRPLAMPTRYYVALPRKVYDRYEWFAVDRRREVVALSEEPQWRFWGKSAIRRSDALGLDLEFRKMDGSEWCIHFLDDAIVFSNALLTVRMDTTKRNHLP